MVRYVRVNNMHTKSIINDAFTVYLPSPITLNYNYNVGSYLFSIVKLCLQGILVIYILQLLYLNNLMLYDIGDNGIILLSLSKKIKKPIILTIATTIIITKRNTGGMVLKIGTILSGPEKEALAKILYLKKNMLKNGALNDDNMVDFAMHSIIISPKIAQHVITTAFPQYTAPLSLMQKKFPHIKFSVTNNNSLVTWDQILASCGMHHKNINPIFKEGKITSLANKDISTIATKTSKAYQNTHQAEPDYLYEYYNIDGQQIWSRYYDWKTGHISPNNGHILGTADVTLYEQLSEELLKKQFKFYRSHDLINDFLDTIINKDTHITWGQRNLFFQEFLLKNMDKLSQDINPSFIFKTNLFVNAEHAWHGKKYKFFESSISINALENKSSTDDTIAKALIFNEKSSTIIENYSSTRGYSILIADICYNLWKTYI